MSLEVENFASQFRRLREKTPQGQDTVTFFLQLMDSFQQIAPRFIELQREKSELLTENIKLQNEHEQLLTEHRQLQKEYKELKAEYDDEIKQAVTAIEKLQSINQQTKNEFKALTKKIRDHAGTAYYNLLTSLYLDDKIEHVPVKELKVVEENLNAILNFEDPVIQSVFPPSLTDGN